MSLLYNSPTANAGTGSLQSNAIRAQRDPSINDTLYTIGQIWVNEASQEVFFLVGFDAGQGVWVGTSAGTGTFSSLTVDPGPTELHGILTVDGNIDTPGVITLNADGGPTETIVIESSQGTGEGSVQIKSLSGGITVQAAGAGNGATFESTAGPVFIQSGENAAPSLTLQSTGGTSTTMRIKNTDGTNDAGTVSTAAISIVSSLGGVGIQAQKAIHTSSTTTTTIESVTGTTVTAGGVLTLDSSDTTGADVVIQASNAGGGIIIDPETILSMAPSDTVTTIGLGNVIPAVNRTTTVNGGAVATAHTDTLNLATGGVNTSASAIKTVNIASGTTLLGQTNINIGTGTAASGTHDINIGTGTGGGTKTITLGNVDALTDITEFGDLSINTSTSIGSTVIGNKTAGGVVQLFSLTNIDIDPVATLTVAPTATVTAIEIGNITPTVNRTTTINGGAVVAAHTDTVNIATGGVNTDAGATKTVNIASGTNLLGSTNVNIATGTAASGAKTVTIGNIDALTTINALGVVDINTAGTGATTIGSAATGGAIALTTNTSVGIDAKTASHFTVTGANNLTLSSTAGEVDITSSKASATAINVTAPAGGVSLSGGAAATLGNVGIVNQQQAAAAGPSATVTVINNSRVGSVTFTGYTQAASATLVLTLTNSFITATSPILATTMNAGSNDAQMQITRIKQGSGTADITIKNQGAAALNGDMVLSYIILS